jgi:hypothetical protein
VELKRRNPRFGCVRIVQQISHVFDVELDKDVVRRVRAKHYRPGNSGADGPSWLTFLAHAKYSLRSVDLFRCESLRLSTLLGRALNRNPPADWLRDRAPQSGRRHCHFDQDPEN